MNRRMAGALAAAAAAPYLGAVFYLLMFSLEQIRSSDLSSLSDAGGLLGLMLFMGTFGLLIYGWFVFPTACLASFILTKLRVRSAPLIVGTGTLIGFGFGSYLNYANEWTFTGGLTFSGAVCGWIYWRIAIRQTPDNARPITTL